MCRAGTLHVAFVVQLLYVIIPEEANGHKENTKLKTGNHSPDAIIVIQAHKGERWVVSVILSPDRSKRADQLIANFTSQRCRREVVLDIRKCKAAV